jgi:hypothetical protein
MKIILTLSLSLLLSACTSTPTTSRSPGLHTIPVGSIVKLNQALTISPQQVRTSVQFGEASASVNSEEPYCHFEINTLINTPTTLPAGEYRITRVRRFEDPYYSHQPSSTKKVATANEAAAWAIMATSPDSHWTYTTVFSLESPLQPDIRQMVCGNTFPTGYEARHMTLREFKALAGTVMSLVVKNK